VNIANIRRTRPFRHPLLVAGAAALLILTAAPAWAEVPTATRDTPKLSGVVWTTVFAGDTVYLGGDFTSVKVGNSTYSRQRLAAFNANTGALLPWAPSVDSTVRALAVADGSVYAAGEFVLANGSVRDNLAKFGALTGALDPVLNLAITGQPYALAVGAGRLYLGGSFAAVGSSPRSNLAAVTLSSDTLDPSWTPSADDRVSSLTVTANRIYAGGRFRRINGRRDTVRIAALSPSTGAPDPTFTGYLPYTVNSVAADSTSVYAGVGGPGGRVTALDNHGAPRWTITTDGDIAAVGALDGTVYAGGHFDHVCRTARVADIQGDCLDGRVDRVKLFAVNADGQLSPWIANANGVVGVLTVATDPVRNRLAVGGAFTTINGVTRNRFAQFG